MLESVLFDTSPTIQQTSFLKGAYRRLLIISSPPEANPGVYLSSALGITFPFMLIVENTSDLPDHPVLGRAVSRMTRPIG